MYRIGLNEDRDIGYIAPTYFLNKINQNKCAPNIHNINGRDVQRKNVVNNVAKSSLWAP